MLLLTSTSDLVQVITSAAGDIEVHASWVDNASGTITPGRTNTPSITSATTTTVVGSPAASTQRNLKHLNIENNSATISNNITVQHTDGTTVIVLATVTLLPGEHFLFDANGQWTHYDNQGGPYVGNVAQGSDLSFAYGITGTLVENVPRHMVSQSLTVLASGTMNLIAIYIRAGMLVSNISFSAGTPGATTPTNCFFGLYNTSLTKLAESANATTTAWTAYQVRTLAMTTPYRVPTTGLYYAAIMVTAGTVPQLMGVHAAASATWRTSAPSLGGTSTGSLTTSIPATAAAITNTVWTPWVAIT